LYRLGEEELSRASYQGKVLTVLTAWVSVSQSILKLIIWSLENTNTQNIQSLIVQTSI